MGFNDLPIPNNGTTHTITNPLGLGQVANYTKNPILDVGYQCKDARPYFAFTYSSTTYYIRVHPDNLTVNDSVGMYSASSITKFGVTYTKMTKLSGSGTVLTSGSSATISYGGNTYSYDSQSDVDVFLNKLNPWSFYKPYEYTGLSSDEYGQTRCDDLVNGTTYWDSIIKSQQICCGFNYGKNTSSNTNVYCTSYSMALDNACATNSVWNYTRPSTIFRLTDFIGYNKNAVCPGYSDLWSPEKKIRKVSSPNQGMYYSYDATADNCEIDIFEMDPILRQNNWYVGAIVSKVILSGTTVTSRLYSDYYLSGQVNTLFPAEPDPEGDISEATAEISLSHGEGNYEICWVLSSGGSSNVSDNQPYVILPNGYSLINYSFNNQDVIILPYEATFETTYPDTIVTGQIFNFAWNTTYPPRTDDGLVVNEQLTFYDAVTFFFTVHNYNETTSMNATITIETELGGTNGVPTYKVQKTIQNISPRSHFNVGITVPFDRSATVNAPQKIGDDTAGDSSCGLGFKVYYTYSGHGTIYIDLINKTLSGSNPGYQYLYTEMINNDHWLTSSDYSFIWGSDFRLNSYAPVLNDSSIISV